jgi:hypothetical protein
LAVTGLPVLSSTTWNTKSVKPDVVEGTPVEEIV